jgi:superfamily I DNA and/or RNA helicase
VVVLDEASQITEPTSLVPVLRSRCRYVIAAGDPLQLPPVIAHPAHLTAAAGAAAAAAAAAVRAGHGGGAAGGLLRPLFVRLTDLGHSPNLLRWQYR